LRKEVEIIIDDQASRDNGKVFAIKEMPAYDLEWFAVRAFQAMGSSGMTVPPEVVKAGAIGFALLCYQAFMQSTADQIKPLRDEMMKGVYVRGSAGVDIPFDPSVVFELSTLIKIREAWLKLHTGFTLSELAAYLNARVAEKMAKTVAASS
jgi:hypothetical protein